MRLHVTRRGATLRPSASRSGAGAWTRFLFGEGVRIRDSGYAADRQDSCEVMAAAWFDRATRNEPEEVGR